MDEGTVRPNQGDRPGGQHDADFVAWAMGSREAARKLVIMPIAAGVLAALMATELDFGAGIPVFMDSIGWDLLSGYRCFVLPKQLVFFCMIAAPIASVLVLLTRPRLRGPADESAPSPPSIASADQFTKIVGVVAFAVMIAIFHLFETGWVLACRLESMIGVISRYLLGAVVVVFAPTVSIAALTLAYRFRDRVNFGWAPDEARAAMRPIGMMIAIIALITLDYAVLTRHGIAHRPLVTTLIWMTAAFLLTQGSFAVARIVGWLSAALIVITVGDVLTAPLQTPLGLLMAKFRAAPVDSVLTVILVFVWFGFALWIYQAVRAKPILDARAASGRTRSPPWTGFACGALIFAFGLGSYLMMDAKYGEEARKLARQSYGEQYAYQIKSYGYGRYTDHVYVELEGYNDRALIKVQVDWKP